jgi:phosphatidylglycerophosphatase C
MAFLAWRASAPRFVSGMLKLAPAAITYVLNRDRNVLKASTVSEFLTGTPRDALDREAEAFAAAVWDRFMRPDALETWTDWGRRGAERVIVTASPESLIAPFAARLGADRLIGTRLRFDAEDRVAGDFLGVNCRGPEKVRRLRAVFGPQVTLAAAYGDSAGDHEMMEIAEVKGLHAFSGRP